MKKTILLLFVCALGKTLAAQTIYQESGDMKMLAGEKKMSVQYDFSSFNMGDDTLEAAYLKSRRDDLNAKGAGRGDNFVERWNNNKTAHWEVKFEDLFNKYSKMQVQQNATDAKYTMIIKVTTVFPGLLNVGVMGGASTYISCNVLIVETGHPDKILSNTLMKHVMGAQCGMLPDDPGLCVQEAFARLGKDLVAYMKKSM
ncbi:MAG: hypothetical protein JWP12_141 [Bacteroidetes bacterium]|nr:hypothetical protein [Bacteroidota bacterium]